MRIGVILITVAICLLLPNGSVAGSMRSDPGPQQTVRRGDPKLYADVRITLKKGGKVDGWWVSRRDDAVCVLENGKMRWIPNAEIKDIKDPTKAGFWKKVWRVAQVPVFIAAFPVIVVVTLVDCSNGC